MTVSLDIYNYDVVISDNSISHVSNNDSLSFGIVISDPFLSDDWSAKLILKLLRDLAEAEWKSVVSG